MVQNNHPERTKSNLSLKIAPVCLALVFLVLLMYFNYPSPKIEIDWFTTGLGVSEQIGSYGQIVTTNVTESFNYPTLVNVTKIDEKTLYFYNMTFQAINSGKVAAEETKMTISGEPSDKCRVSWTMVYKDELTPTNLLAIAKDDYVIGRMETEKRYIFSFQVEVEKENNTKQCFIIEITSRNSPRVQFTVEV